MTSWQIVQGDALERLREMPDASVQCCVTSPPYFGLRDYGTAEWAGGDPACDHKTPPSIAHTTLGEGSGGNAMSPEARARWAEGQRTPYRDRCPRCNAVRVDRQLGLEGTPDEFVAGLVAVFAEVRRVLRDDGTLWLNIGDSYAGSGAGSPGAMSTLEGNGHQGGGPKRRALAESRPRGGRLGREGYKSKDLLGIPWMLAFALRADGWYLRSDVIWSKPNPMPESVTDRPTSAHEHMFLLSKSPRYFYDADAIREGYAPGSVERIEAGFKDRYSEVASGGFRGDGGPDGEQVNPSGRNKRNVWEIATSPYAEAHFATFPPKLVEPCLLAGTSPKACGKCGAPWRRVVESTGAVNHRDRVDVGDWIPDKGGNPDGKRSLSGATYQHQRRGTDRWEPSCDHVDDTGVCLVLDPFAGSGTVGVVCRWYGRDFIGVELNPEYAELARRRIDTDGLLGRPAKRPRRDADGQLDLLGMQGS